MGILMRLQADVLILGEVWFEKAKVNLGVLGYHTARGRAACRGKILVLWIRQVPGEQHKKVRNEHKLLVVLLQGRHGHHLVGGVHMPHRKEAAQNAEEARALMALAKLYLGTRVFILGEWNCYISRHKVTRALARSLRTDILTTADVGLLHKDWALVPSSLVDEGHVTYTPVVADHPWAVAMVITHSGGGARMAMGHKPIVISEWKDTHWRAYGNLMEALSYGEVFTSTWLVLMREGMSVLAAIAGAKWESRYPGGHREKQQGLVGLECQAEEEEVSQP